jgi:hypothetical protein
MKTLINPGGDQILEGGSIVAVGHVRSFFDLNIISMQRKKFRNWEHAPSSAYPRHQVLKVFCGSMEERVPVQCNHTESDFGYIIKLNVL